MGVLADAVGWKIGIYGFVCFKVILYLLTSILKRQLEGLALVTHATVDSSSGMSSCYGGCDV